MTAELINFSHAVPTASDDLLDLALRRLSIPDQIAIGKAAIRLEEGSEQGEARVRTIAVIADTEAKALYGGDHCIRLPLSSGRHGNRVEAAVQALRGALLVLGESRNIAA